MHTCAFWTKDSCWSKQGWRGALGRTGSAWSLSLSQDSRRKAPPAPRFSVYHIKHLSITWINSKRCGMLECSYQMTKGHKSEKWKEDCCRDYAGMGWVLVVPNVPRTGERTPPLLLLPECIHFPQCKYQRFLLCFLTSCSSPRTINPTLSLTPHLPFVHSFSQVFFLTHCQGSK